MTTFNLQIDETVIPDVNWVNYDDRMMQLIICFESSRTYMKDTITNALNDGKTLYVVTSNGDIIYNFDITLYTVVEVMNRLIPDNVLTFVLSVTN